jgi:hypothetical protein
MGHWPKAFHKAYVGETPIKTPLVDRFSMRGPNERLNDYDNIQIDSRPGFPARVSHAGTLYKCMCGVHVQVPDTTVLPSFCALSTHPVNVL